MKFVLSDVSPNQAGDGLVAKLEVEGLTADKVGKLTNLFQTANAALADGKLSLSEDFMLAFAFAQFLQK